MSNHDNDAARHLNLKPRWQTTLSGIMQVAAAAILLQTLFFKFTGAPEARHIFTTDRKSVV